MKTKNYSRIQQKMPFGIANESLSSFSSFFKNFGTHDYLKCKAILTPMMIAFLFLGSQFSFGQTVFSENMGTPSATTAISANTFQNSASLTYGNGGQTNPADVRATTTSSGYTGASGGGNVFFTSVSGAYGFSIESINAAAYTSLSLSYGYRKESATLHATFSVDYWNGTSWVTLANTSAALFNEATSAAAGWYLAKSLSLPTAAQINGLKIRFVKTGAASLRLDDVKLTGTVAATPVITSSTGSLSALSTTYGTVSGEATFSVSGANMQSGILVTPPTGFEVSLASGGTFTSTVTVGSTGTISSTPVYVRLKANAAVSGSPYTGNVVCSATNATAVNVATTSSTVNPKGLTITGITANNKVFDGTATASLSGTPTLSGVVSGDTVNITGTPVATFANNGPGTGIAVTVTGYSLSGASATNYTVSQPSGLTADITSGATPGVTSVLTHSAIYGTTAPTYTITASDSPTSYTALGLPLGLTLNSTTGAITGTPTAIPGAYNVSISASNINGPGSAVTLVYTITAKNLTVTGAAAANKEYDRTTTATITGTLSGIYNTDVVGLVGGGTFDTKNVGTAKAVTSSLTLNGADAGKYTLTQPAGLTADITAKALTIATPLAQNKPFDGNTNAVVTGTLSGVISPDVVTLSGTGTFASSAVGNAIAVTSTSTIGGADAGNYSLTQPTGLTANITALPTTLVAGDVAIVAVNSGTPDSFSIVLLRDITTGTVINFTDNGFTSATAGRIGEGFLTYTAPSDLPYGTVLTWTNGVSATGWSSAAPTNFSFAGAGDQLFVFQGPTANWNSQTGITLVFGMNYVTALSATSSTNNTVQPSALGSTVFLNLPSAANANGYFSNTGSAATSVNVCGSAATVLALIATPGKWFGNSGTIATFPSLSVLAVCPPPSIVASGSLAALTTTYGTASANRTFTVSGNYLTANILVTPPAGFEVSTNATSGFSGSVTLTQSGGSVGSTTLYIRLASTTSAGTYSGDVVVSSTGATSQNIATTSSVVNPKGVTISGIAIANKVYDGTTSATITGTAVLNGVLVGDAANVVLGGSPLADFVTADPGVGIAVTVTGYSISGTAALNYLLAQPTGLTADITSVPTPVISSALTFIAVYGTPASTYTITATESPSSYSATGLPTGLTVNTTTGEITGTPTATPGSYNVIISATNAGGSGNATLVYTITPKELTVTDAVAVNKIYNGTTAATITGGILNGIYGTDVVTISGGGLFDTKNVGTAKSVTAALTLAGADAAKYIIATQPTGLTADITPKALTLSGVLAQSKVFDGNTNATITGTLIVVVSGDVVSFNGTGVFASSAIANNIAVTSTATLIGADAGNYTLTQPTGLTANITEPVLYSNIFTGTAACPTQGNTPTLATNVTGVPLTRSTIACTTASNVFNSTTLNNTATINANSYIEFSATANAGYALKVGSVSFFRQSSATAPNKLEVRYSTDDFVTSTTWGSAPLSPTTGAVATWDFPDFVTQYGATVKFRIYPYGTQRADLGAGAASATGSFRLDDVTIYGTVVTGSTAAVLTGSTAVCPGSSTDLSVAITGGVSPYTVVYSNGTSNATVTSYVSGSPISVTPASTSTYTLVSVTDSNALAGTGNTGTATVTVYPVTPAPTGSATQSFNYGATVANLVATGTAIQWYDAATVGNLVSASTVLSNGVTYYASQTLNGCVSPTRLAVTASITAYYTTIKSTFWNATVAPNAYIAYQALALPSATSITKYKVEVTNNTTNAVGTFESTATTFRIIDAAPSVASYGTSYGIKVSLQINGIWQPYGISKQVTTTALPAAPSLNTYCGQSIPTIDKILYCSVVPLAVSYTFEVTRNGSASVETATYTNALNNFRLTNLISSTFSVVYNSTYSVRIKSKSVINGVEVESLWSTPCLVSTPNTPPVPVITSGCGVVPTNFTLIKCTSVVNATSYRFTLTNTTTTISLPRSFNSFSLSLVTGLTPGTVYTVTPYVTLYGQEYQGIPCDITTPGTAAKAEAKPVATSVVNDFTVKAYPNPFANNFKLNVTTSSEAAMQMKVYDMLGKLIETKTIDASAVETVEVGTNYPSGVYHVVLTQEDQIQTLRVIKR